MNCNKMCLFLTLKLQTSVKQAMKGPGLRAIHKAQDIRGDPLLMKNCLFRQKFGYNQFFVDKILLRSAEKLVVVKHFIHATLS